MNDITPAIAVSMMIISCFMVLINTYLIFHIRLIPLVNNLLHDLFTCLYLSVQHKGRLNMVVIGLAFNMSQSVQVESHCSNGLSTGMYFMP